MTISTTIDIDEQRLAAVLDQASKQLETAKHEVVLDFSSIRRIRASDVSQLEEIARAAEVGEIKIALRGVDVDIYKTLKLMNLTPKFLFVD